MKSRLDRALKEFELIGNHTPILPEVFPKLHERHGRPVPVQAEVPEVAPWNS